MAEPGLTYSNVVTWLKIVLPLAALALLSTLFLFSRDTDPTSAIPFAEVDLEQKAREQRLTAPVLSGMTSGGDRVTVRADSARPDPEDPNLLTIDNVAAHIEQGAGEFVAFESAAGVYNAKANEVRLSGGVNVRTSTGYSIRTETLMSRLDITHAESDGSVIAEGPPGRLEAGRFVMTRQGDSDGAYLLFTNGVKLLYQPNG